MCILLTYFMVLAKLVIPIKGEEYFNWKQTDIAKLWVLSMITGAIPTMVVISILAKYVNDFFLYLSSLITLLLCLLLMGLLPMFTNYVSQTMFATAIITCVLTRSLRKGFQKQDFSCISERLKL